MRTLIVLAPTSKAGPATAAADPDPRPAEPAGPVHTRETASDGYHQALAAHQEARPERRVDPAIAAPPAPVGEARRGGTTRR